MNLDPVFDIAQRAARSPDRMTQRRFQATRGFGIWIFLDVAQRSARHYLAAMNSRAGPKIHNVIGAPYCFFIVLDHEQRVTLVSQRSECFEQALIVTWMQ